MAVKTVNAIINGITYELSLNTESGYYEADFLAPQETSYNNNSGHYYPITIKATDVAGNVTKIDDTDVALGEYLRLRVKEKIAPVIMITNPTDEEIMSNTKPSVNWTITDKESGVNPESISVSIDGEEVIKNGIVKTLITNGYQCEYTIPRNLSDGTHTIAVNANDNDDNSAIQRVVTFIIDTTPPSLSITNPINNYVTNINNIMVTGKTSDVYAGIEKVTIKLNAGQEREIEVASNGDFSESITIEEGVNTIAIKSYDTLGLTSSVTRIVTLDLNSPIIESVSITPNPVSTGEILTISVSVTD